MKIRTKLLLVLVPLAAGSVLATSEFSRRAVHGVMAGELAKRGVAAAEEAALDPQTLHGYQTRSETALLKVLTKLKESVGALSALVVTEEGRILAHTNVAEHGGWDRQPVTLHALRSRRAEYRIESLERRPVMMIAVPVLVRPASEDAFLFLGAGDQHCLGVIRVSLPLEEALGVSGRISTQVLLIVSLVCSITLGLMVVVIGKVLAPIPHLVAATMRVGGGNLGATVPVRSGDEIGELAESFNRMSRDLAETTVSHEFLNSILTHMQDPVLVTRADGTIRMANESAVRMLARPGDDLDGLRAEELLRLPTQAGSALGALAGSPAGVDAEFRRADGSVVPALIGASPLQDPDGNLQGFVVTGKDITDLRRAQDELRASVSLLRATLDSTADGILVVDKSGKITSFNENFVRVWRIPPAIMEKRDDEAALAFVLDQLDDPQGFLRKVQDLYDQPEMESYDLLTFKDGRVIERYSRPQRIEGVSVGRVWSFRDITERRQAEAALQRSEEQLRQAQKMEAIGSLAGGVAHDFNNLLTIIKGYGQLLIRMLGETGKGHREAVEVLKAAERAAAMTRQLLAFSRKQVLQPKVLNLNVVVMDMERMLERLIGEDVELRTLRQENLGTILADPSQIEQVLLNLAVNARDAMPNGGRITIETANFDLASPSLLVWTDLQPGSYVMLSVADTGCGMNATTLSRVFEPFFTTKAPGKGTGLGLSTVYGIVKQSGGAIAVDSEPGKGTIFRICMPRIDADALRDTMPAPEELESELSKQSGTILVVEDEDTVRGLITSILQSAGYTVLEASDGMDGLETAGKMESPIDLVVTDVVMPRMSGGAFAEAIARERPDIKILFISGYTDDEVVRRGVRDQGISFLQKPFSPDDLIRSVRRVLEREGSDSRDGGAPADLPRRALTTRGEQPSGTKPYPRD